MASTKKVKFVLEADDLATRTLKTVGRAADELKAKLAGLAMSGSMLSASGLQSRLLSRTTEDAVTVTSVLVPWNTCGMTQATILGVPTFTYLPYCFFNILSPLMSICIAAIGYKIKRTSHEESQNIVIN